MPAHAEIINIGDDCAAPDCQRIILFRGSPFCAYHRPQNADKAASDNVPVKQDFSSTSSSPRRRCFARRGSRRIRLSSTRCSPTDARPSHPTNTFQSPLASISESTRDSSATYTQDVDQDTDSTSSTELSTIISNIQPRPRNSAEKDQHATPLPGSPGVRRGQSVGETDKFRPRAKAVKPSFRMPADTSTNKLYKGQSQQAIPLSNTVKLKPPLNMRPENGSQQSSVVDVKIKAITQVPAQAELSLPEYVPARTSSPKARSHKGDCPPTGCALSAPTTGGVTLSEIRDKENIKNVQFSQPSIQLEKTLAMAEYETTRVTKKARVCSWSDDDPSEESDLDMANTSNTDSDSAIVNCNAVGSEQETYLPPNKPTTVLRAVANHEKMTASFDSAAFDRMIYRQSGLQPPMGVVLTRRDNSKYQTSAGERKFLRVNPVIHTLHNRSKEWYEMKSQQIQQRPRRKAWFGKVGQRQQWLRAKEARQEEAHLQALQSGKTPPYREPKPRGLKRPMNFGDVPEEELHEDVRKNPAWMKACAWFRESDAEALRRQCRDNSARETRRFFMKEFKGYRL